MLKCNSIILLIDSIISCRGLLHDHVEGLGVLEDLGGVRPAVRPIGSSLQGGAVGVGCSGLG